MKSVVWLCIQYSLYLTDSMSVNAVLNGWRYLNLAQDLQRLNLLELSTNEKLAFFLNLYNAMVIHALIRIGRSDGMIARRSFFTDFQYVVGGYSYSLNSIRNNIIRGGHRQSYAFIKPFMRGGNTHHKVMVVHASSCMIMWLYIYIVCFWLDIISSLYNGSLVIQNLIH